MRCCKHRRRWDDAAHLNVCRSARRSRTHSSRSLSARETRDKSFRVRCLQGFAFAVCKADTRQVTSRSLSARQTRDKSLRVRHFASDFAYTCTANATCHATSNTCMGWLATIHRLLKMIGLFCRNSSLYRALLQKRPIILRSLLIEATLYSEREVTCSDTWDRTMGWPRLVGSLKS